MTGFNRPKMSLMQNLNIKNKLEEIAPQTLVTATERRIFGDENAFP